MITTTMSRTQALGWLVHHSPVVVSSYRELGEAFGWEKTKTWRVVQDWKRLGYVETASEPDTGRTTVTVVPNVVPVGAYDNVADDADDGLNNSERSTSQVLPGVAEGRSEPAVSGETNAPWERERTEPAATATVYAHYADRPRDHAAPADALDWLTRLVAIGMAIVTAYFSIHGLLTLFPGDEIGVTVFGIGVECLKVAGVMYLSRHASSIWWLWRVLAIVAVIIAAGLNSASVYAKFASLHSQSPAAAAATREASAAELDARIEQYQGRVNDLTRRAAVLDDTMDNVGNAVGKPPAGDKKAAKAAKAAANTLAGTLNNVRPERAGLTTDRDAAANELARLKAQRGRITAADHQASAEELPLLLMSNLAGTDVATVLRWLVCAVVICGDPAALILLAAVGSRRKGSAA
jgi:hypothetical protein